MVLDVEPRTGSLCLQRLAAETNRASLKDVTIATKPKSRTARGATRKKTAVYNRSNEPGEPKGCNDHKRSISLVLSAGTSPQREMTLDYQLLAIETVLCSQGSFRRVLGI